MIAGNNLIFNEPEKISISPENNHISYKIDINKLIIQCKKDKKSLEILYNCLKKDVFAVAFSILNDFHLAEDCVVETFVRLTQVKRFSASGGDGKGFVLKIARNCAMEIYRRYKRESYSEIIQAYGETEKTVEDSIYVNQLLKCLNEKQRQVIIMKIYSELTFKEIAKIMRCPESTVKARYKKAIELLKKKAGEQ